MKKYLVVFTDGNAITFDCENMGYLVAKLVSYNMADESKIISITFLN
jgi:hypothetical protein